MGGGILPSPPKCEAVEISLKYQAINYTEKSPGHM